MKHRSLTAFLVVAAVFAGGCSKRSESVAIKPEITIGSLHSGMTIQQVFMKFGQPEQARTNSGIIYALEYSDLGISVLAGEDGVVREASVCSPFAQRTNGGIGIGSSRADVIRAYGEPTLAKPTAPNIELLEYKKLNLVCELKDGKVDSMQVIFKAAK
jgi:hypothetical protein